jgi:nucleoside-diphosphate-sugar epimerase
MTASLDQLAAEDDLEDCLSAPSHADVACCRRLNGDVLVLGAGGKMGPSLVKRIVRGFSAAGIRRRVVAASRFSSLAARQSLEAAGAVVRPVDLLDPASIETLPKCPYVLFLAGRKFGSTDNTALTWAINTIASAHAARYFSGSKIVAFSTGNVYPFVPVASGGSVEIDTPSPRGEYAQSCLGRERVFEYYSMQQNTPTLLFRLNYALDLRYGVLVDIARSVQTRQPVNRSVGYFNVIWQGDANSYALRALEGCQVPARPLNVTGPETLAVTEVAEYFGRRFGAPPTFVGEPSDAALLSNASACHEWLGRPHVSAAELLDAVASWVQQDGATLNKPTHFEVTDGTF